VAWSDLLAGVAFYLILEGLFPFVLPEAWRRSVVRMSQLDDRELRGFGLAVVIAGLTIHDSWERVFINPASERNPYAYAHTVEDLLRLPPRLEQSIKQDHMSQPLIAVVAADPWPLPWYLRHFTRVGFWQPGQDPGPADFYITSPETAGQLSDHLKGRLPEFFGLRPEVLILLWPPAPVNPTAHE